MTVEVQTLSHLSPALRHHLTDTARDLKFETYSDNVGDSTTLVSVVTRELDNIYVCILYIFNFSFLMQQYTAQITLHNEKEEQTND